MATGNTSRSKFNRSRAAARSSFARYFWVLVKNIVGWVLIISSIIVGGIFPGPLGTPMFLIGFALITFPGKRHITSRVLRGKPIDLKSRTINIVVDGATLILPPLAIWLIARRPGSWLHRAHTGWLGYLALAIAGIIFGWFFFWGLLRLINHGLRYMPRLRRWARPHLRRIGVNLLPPRWKLRPIGKRNPQSIPQKPSEEIMEIDPARIKRARGFMQTLGHHFLRLGRATLHRKKPLIGLIVTVCILIWMFRPVHQHWAEVRQRVLVTSLSRFALAAVMFAIFLFVFRVISWRKIVMAFGLKLPFAPAARIWSTSELARYLPGVIWQVWGRVYLVKPYGLGAAACSTSQILELAIFLMANVLVAIATLPFYLSQMSDSTQHWLLRAVILAPLLLILLHPRIFYGIINGVLKKIKKPPIQNRLPGRTLLALLGWAIVGLCWQGLAIWILLAQPQALDLGIRQIGLVIGAYCLAWCAGFLVVTAPAGFGIREFVLVSVFQFALPAQVRQQFPGTIDQKNAELGGVLVFLAVLLRLWTIAGELILSATAHLLDYKGAMGLPGAPGRIGSPATEKASSDKNGSDKNAADKNTIREPKITPAERTIPASPGSIAGDIPS
jgi:hypothetical protein